MPFTDAQIEHYKTRGYVAGSRAPGLDGGFLQADLQDLSM